MLNIEISLSHQEIEELINKGRTVINYAKSSGFHNGNFLKITVDQEHVADFIAKKELGNKD
jgi:hypothetical protein